MTSPVRSATAFDEHKDWGRMAGATEGRHSSPPVSSLGPTDFREKLFLLYLQPSRSHHLALPSPDSLAERIYIKTSAGLMSCHLRWHLICALLSGYARSSCCALWL